MAEPKKENHRKARELSVDEMRRKLLAEEREALIRLAETARAIGRLGRTPGKISEPSTALAAGRAEAANTPEELRDIYHVLLDLFEQDHKNVTHVTPASVLGEYPLGYERRPLQDFYDESVYGRFRVRVSTDEVGTAGTVWNLTKKIHEKGGRA
jgi:hypothetical protein